jgi:hypothetical protein
MGQASTSRVKTPLLEFITLEPSPAFEADKSGKHLSQKEP